MRLELVLTDWYSFAAKNSVGLSDKMNDYVFRVLECLFKVICESMPRLESNWIYWSTYVVWKME